MENVEIARALLDVADLIEIQGGNPFRVRAYRNAALTVESQTVALRKMVEDGKDLTELPAVGKDIARHIKELVETGKLGVLEELERQVPRGLIELTRLPGLGAKRAKLLWDQLGIQTLEQLERAARADEIKGIKGFGAKTQQRILEGIAAYRKRGSRFKIVDADQYVEPLVEYLRRDPAVESVDVAGSYRRRRETVGDIDVLVIAKDAGAVMKHFTAYGDVTTVQLAGDTKGTVVLKSGLQVDLRILPKKSYGAALQYFTGSKEHAVKVRQRAVERGLRLSEYGVFEVEKGKEPDDEERDPWAGRMVAGKTEEEVYAALDLPWIPPELRENRGEVEAAARDALPDLIVLEDVRGDLQMHSTWSDGKYSLEEMMDACVERGYEYFAITDHSKALAMTGGLDAKKLREQWKEIDEIASRRSDIRILKGMEVDILADGTLDLEDEMLAQLDVVLASIHSRFDLPAAKQTERVLRAIRHPEVNILAHPTGRQINRRDAMDFDLDEVLRCAVEHEVVVEINAHPDRLDLKDTHAMRAKELGGRMAISTDAHRPAELAFMRYGVDQARRAWLEKGDVINTLPYDRLAEILAKRRP
jgi:DNA polymerase (family 10)